MLEALRHPGGLAGQDSQLGSAELAYLSGRERGLLHSVLAGLIRRGVLAANKNTKQISRLKELGPNASPLEARVYGACTETGTPVEWLLNPIAKNASDIEEQLYASELVLSPVARLAVRIVPMLVMFGVVMIGVIKILVGLSRHRPVGFLVGLCLLAIVVSLVIFIRPVSRTRRGDAVLRTMRREKPALKTSVAVLRNNLNSGDIALLAATGGVVGR